VSTDTKVPVTWMMERIVDFIGLGQWLTAASQFAVGGQIFQRGETSPFPWRKVANNEAR